MTLKLLLLLSFSFFGNAETDGVFLNGYANGVISFASSGIYEECIKWDQLRLLYQNSQEVNFVNFINVLFGNDIKPVFYTGVSLSFWGPRKVIVNAYFTGAIAGIR